jgi:hypothetical protein
MLSTGIGWMLIDDVPTRVSLMALIVTAPRRWCSPDPCSRPLRGSDRCWSIR